MRVLVTGGEGQLARALTRAPPQKIELWAPNRAEPHICATNKLASPLDDVHPDRTPTTDAHGRRSSGQSGCPNAVPGR